MFGLIYQNQKGTSIMKWRYYGWWSVDLNRSRYNLGTLPGEIGVLLYNNNVRALIKGQEPEEIMSTSHIYF